MRFGRWGCRALVMFCASVVACASLGAAAVASPPIQAPGTKAEVRPNFRAPVAHVAEVQQMAATTPERPPMVIISDLTDYTDDNVAILMLLKSGLFDIRGIVTTSGNVCASRGAAEARRFLRAAGVAVPVVQGFPLARHEARRAFYERVERPSWQRPAYVGAFADPSSCGEDAVDPPADSQAPRFLIEQARAATGGLTVILIGPATVLADALKTDPELPGFIRRVYAMGGALEVPGNVTRYAEFNVWFDPEAMAELLASAIPLTLVPLDATSSVTYEGLPPVPGPPSRFPEAYLAAYLDHRASTGKTLKMWDEVLAAIVIDPAIVEASTDEFVTASTVKDDRYGETRASLAPLQGASRPIAVVTKVSPDGVRQLMARLLFSR